MDAAGPQRKRRRWLRILLLLGVASLVVVAVAPYVAGWSAIRQHALRLALPDYPGQVQCASLKLRWFGESQIEGLSLRDLDQEPLITVEQIQIKKSLLSLLLNANEVGVVEIRDPTIQIRRTENGSNLRDAFQPMLEKESSGQLDQLALRIRNAKVVLVDARSTTPSWELSNADIDFELAGAGTAGWKVELMGMAGQTGQPPQRVHAVVAHQPSADAETYDVRIKELPLAIANSFLPNPHRSLSGTCSGNVTAQWNATENALSLNCDNLAIDRFALHDSQSNKTWSQRRIALSGKMAHSPKSVDLSTVRLSSDACEIAADGQLLLPSTEQPPSLNDWLESLARSNLNVDSTIPISELARIDPEFLTLREGTAIESGEIRIVIESGASENPGLHALISASDLVANYQGRQLAWNSPIQLQVSTVVTENGLALRNVQCSSDFLKIEGHGTVETGQVQITELNLSDLQNRLDQFFELPKLELRGSASAVLEWQTSQQQRNFTAAVQGNQLYVKNPDMELSIDSGAVRVAVGDGEPITTAWNSRLVNVTYAMLARTPEEQDIVQRDPVVSFQGQADYDPKRRKLILHDARLETRPSIDGPATAKLNIAGEVVNTEAGMLCLVDVDAMIDLAPELARRFPALARSIHADGQESLAVHMEGLVPHDYQFTPQVIETWTGHGQLNWQTVEAWEVGFEPGSLSWQLKQGVVAFAPIQLEVRPAGQQTIAEERGRVHLHPTIYLGDSPMVHFAPGKIADNIQITPEMCHTWMKYAAPLLADATSANGTFSLTMNEFLIPLNENDAAGINQAKVDGKLDIHGGQVGPGPLADQVLGAVQSLADLTLRSNLDLTPERFLKLPEQTVHFQLQDNAVFHDQLRVQVGDVPVQSRGFVGVIDPNAINLAVGMSIPKKWVANRPLLAGFGGRAFELPLSGTLKDPRINDRAFATLGRQMLEATTGSLINEGLRGLFQRDR